MRNLAGQWIFNVSASVLLFLGQSMAGQWVTYEAKPGAGQGKHIVLLAGDEEYRSEESMPMLGKLLSQRHGFKCSVLFSQDADGTINPNNSTNVPGMQVLSDADLVILAFRFRELPDGEMQHFADYVRKGRPLIAIRTATHAFQYSRNTSSAFATWDWRNKQWPGGFGQQVLGDTWVSHHGVHAKESARGLIDGRHANHPVLRGVKDVWGPSDVYGIGRLSNEDTILLHGLVIKGMKADDPPNYSKSVMPLVWVRDFKWDNGNMTRALTSTIGAAIDFESQDLRRLFVNACYWLTGLEVPKNANVDYVDAFKPSMFGFNTYKKGVKVADHELK